MTTAEHELDPLPLELCGWALSASLAAFGGWAWLLSAGVWTSEITAASAGYILLAGLSLVLQVCSNFAAAAARRARAMKLHKSYEWSVRMMMCGAFYNAFSVHHAWEATGLMSPMFPLSIETAFANAPLLLLAGVLAFFEPALYWVGEALRGEAKTRQAKAQAAAIEDAHRREEERRAADEERRKAERAEARARDGGTVPRDNRRPVTRPAKRVALAGLAALAASPALAHEFAPAAPSLEPEAVTSRAFAGDNPLVAEACRLRDSGLSRAETALAMDKSQRQVTRYWAAAEQAGRAARADLVAA